MNVRKFSIISVLLCVLIMNLLPACGGKPAENQNEAVADETPAEVTTDSIEQETEIPDEKDDEEIAREAEHALYTIYFKQDLLDSKENYYCYSKEMKQRFKDLNISAPAGKTYTSSFSQLLVLYVLVTDIGFGYDIKWDTQDPIVDFNLVVTDVDVIDNDHVDITTKFHNSEDCKKTYRMARENGNFYIDDINGCRDYAVNDLKFHKFHFCESEGKKTVLIGKMGESPLEIALSEKGTIKMPEGGIVTYYFGDCTFPDGKKADVGGYEHKGKMILEALDCKDVPRYYADFDLKASENGDFSGKLSVYSGKEYTVILKSE